VVSRLTRSSAVLVTPLVLLLAAFFVVPVLYLLNESFRTAEGGFTLDSYTDFLGNSVYRTILVRTFLVAAACTVICAALAYPYAYLMTLVGVRMRRWLLVCVLLPFWTSLMVRTYAWLVLLQDSGPVRAALDVVGLGDVPLAGSTTGVLIGMAQILLPFMVLPVYNNLQQIDRTDVLAAQSLGATPRRAFLRVYLPQSLPGLYAGGLLVFIIGLGFYITPVILGSPQNSMMSQLIVQQVNSRLDWASAGAMAAVLAVVTFVCVGLAGRFVDVQRAFGGSGDRDG
jgi:putative spermidine/putrescine transport system permease protein